MKPDDFKTAVMSRMTIDGWTDALEMSLSAPDDPTSFYQILGYIDWLRSQNNSKRVINGATKK